MEMTTTERQRLDRLRVAAEGSHTETVGEWITRTRREQRRPRPLTRPARWRDAVAELRAMQIEYETMRINLPADMGGSEFAKLLEGIRNVNLDAVDVELPREVGRD